MSINSVQQFAAMISMNQQKNVSNFREEILSTLTCQIIGTVAILLFSRFFEELDNKALTFLATLVIKSDDISTAHRLGRKPDGSRQDKRSIIFKLCRRDLKREIIQACRSQKPNFYINEYLTPTRGTIMYVLRKAKQMDPTKIGNARTSEGSISVNIPAASGVSQGQRVQCNTKAALDQLLRAQLNLTSDHFVKKWPIN